VSNIRSTLRRLAALRPDYQSITYCYQPQSNPPFWRYPSNDPWQGMTALKLASLESWLPRHSSSQITNPK